jgi:ribosomal protein L19
MSKTPEIKPLPPFQPVAGLERLPNVKGIHPHELGLEWHPFHKKQPQTLMRSIDFENRLRYGQDGRTEVLDSLKLGDIVVVESFESRSNPKVEHFAGILKRIRKKGIMTNISLRTIIQGVEIEKTLQVYSPMVSKIVVLQSGDEKPEISVCEQLLVKYKNRQILAQESKQ